MNRRRTRIIKDDLFIHSLITLIVNLKAVNSANYWSFDTEDFSDKWHSKYPFKVVTEVEMMYGDEHE